jgi:hypothetical protein
MRVRTTPEEANNGPFAASRKLKMHTSKRISKWFHTPVKCAGLLLCTFLVLFPKAGVKIGDVPVTWGYLLLTIFAVVALPAAIFDDRFFRIPSMTLVVFGCLIPFQCVLLLAMTNGIEPGSSGYALAAIVNFCILPVIILLIWRRWYTGDTIAFLLRVIRFCITVAAAYGIFLFFYRILTGKFIEIPYLTVNADDVGLLEETKHIARGDSGDIFKLISTYNNGNLYGVAMLLFLPIYDLIQPRKINKLLLRIALFLTLSRTVWAGLVLQQVFAVGPSLALIFRNFPQINPRGLTKLLPKLLFVAAILAALVGLAFVYNLGGLSFLADQSLGGRDEQLAILHNFGLESGLPYAGFAEMVFLSALRHFGLIGFVSMLLLFLCPLVFPLIDKSLLAAPIRRAALEGLMIYFAVAWIDGGIDLIPVMAFYWFVVALTIYGADLPWVPALRVGAVKRSTNPQEAGAM